MLTTWFLFAEEGAKGQPPLQPLEMTILMVALPLLFLLFVFRSRSRQERDQDQVLKTLSKGDEVVTLAGIYGTVVSVSETEDKVILKVDDNARLRVVKRAIARNITREDAARAEKEKQKAAK